MKTGFAEILSGMTPAATGQKAIIPDHWRQGRTAYGGLSAALAYGTASGAAPNLPPLRSALVTFVGPVSGDPIFTPEVLRQGRNVTMIDVRANVDGAPVLATHFAFGAARESILSVNCPAPDAPPPPDCEAFTPEIARDFVPQFFHNFDTRLIAGGRPMTGAKDGYIRTWSRHADPASRDGLASLLCLADVLPPAALPMLSQMAPVSSMTWIVNVLADKIETEDGWWHVETKLNAAAGGYSTQLMRIWNTRGDLIVEGMQSVTIFA